jgi:intein/homing endonuclease
MPQRWTIEEEKEKYNELIELYINQNKTIGEIGKILGIAEGSVFDRMKRLNIPTAPQRKLHYLNRKWSNINFPDLSSKLAEFFGIMLGDGHLGSGQLWIHINNNTDRNYNPYVKELIKSLFSIEPRVSYRKDQDMMNLFLSSVDLLKYLRKRGLFVSNKVRDQVDIPPWIFIKDSYKKYFLRGFFDTDGSVYRIRFGVQMNFCNRSIPLLKSTRKLLLDLGYHPSNISSYKVYLTRKTDLYRYVKEIGFGNPKHFKRAKKFGIIIQGA